MNFLLGIIIFSSISSRQDSVAPHYFFKTEVCKSVSYVDIYNFKLDLTNKDFFVFSTTVISTGILPKRKSKTTSMIGKWKYENGVLTLNPINTLKDKRGLYPIAIQFKTDIWCITKMGSDEEINGIPDFMSSINTTLLSN